LERDVRQAVETHLREAGYQLVEQVRIRTWRPDLIAIKDDEIIIVEAKGMTSDLRRGLAQATLYASDATAAYLAVPASRATEWLEEASRLLGVGLMAVDESVKIVIEAEKSTPRPSFVRRIGKTITEASSPRAARSRFSSLPFDRLLRHRGLLRVLLSNPARKYTVRELSQLGGVAYSTTWRIVEDMKAMGVIRTERVGPSQQITLNVDSPIIDDLRELVALGLAPHKAAAREFASRVSELREVRKVILFGSVSEGREEASSDVDVAVVLRRENPRVMDQIYEIVAEVQDRTGMKVVPIAISRSDISAETQLGRGLRAGEVLFERA
jgi:predicted nucleotidyltransferase